ncbi:MAG: SUMF1/EgtB/PvdO family nonheme iron enzyme [Alphaproteobacteria bacterium]|nr:SUMF1/EgtB/PvdO family nonheme iron enzyme [Alphaproteobacteria bacterium]
MQFKGYHRLKAIGQRRRLAGLLFLFVIAAAGFAVYASASIFVRAGTHPDAAQCMASPPSAETWGDTGRAAHDGMILVPAGAIAPHDFWLDAREVSVDDFNAFIALTNYRTTAECFGSGAVMTIGTGAWGLREGADFRHPQGPSGPEAPADHPVTQVSYADAAAYCRWRGARLPSESEFEAAMQSGTTTAREHAFEGEVDHNGTFMANVWTGLFPVLNDEADGFLYTAPVKSYPPTGLGFYDLSGNVWEWTQSWYDPGADQPGFTPSPLSEKVQKGGSFLCAQAVCHGYRAVARGHATPDSSHFHVGFRCAADARTGG